MNWHRIHELADATMFGCTLVIALLCFLGAVHASSRPQCYMLMTATIDWPCVQAVAAGSVAGTTAGDRMVAKALLQSQMRGTKQ